MKTSNVLLSLLFGAIAAAVPLDKRVLVTKTNVVVETVVVFTTVWDGQVATAASTTSAPAAFYEHVSSRTRRTRSRRPTSAVAPSTSAYVAPSAPIVTPQAPSSSAASVVTSVYTPPPAPTTEAPAPSSSTTEMAAPPPSSTEVPAPAPPASTTTPAAPAASSGGSDGSGEVHSGGSMTMNLYGGAVGACGDPVYDTDMAVALAVDVFGDSTVDYMTGKTTNKWCNAKVAITYDGKTTNAVIVDRCAGCTNGGFDMTPSLWTAVTGGLGGTAGDRITGMTWQLVA